MPGSDCRTTIARRNMVRPKSLLVTPYGETRPAACKTGVKCHVCRAEVVRVTFSEIGDFGVCACPWTLWRFDRVPGFEAGKGKVWRSTPNGYMPKVKAALEAAKKGMPKVKAALEAAKKGRWRSASSRQRSGGE